MVIDMYATRRWQLPDSIWKCHGKRDVSATARCLCVVSIYVAIHAHNEVNTNLEEGISTEAEKGHSILPFCRSAVLPLCYSAVLPFCRSAIALF